MFRFLLCAILLYTPISAYASGNPDRGANTDKAPLLYLEGAITFSSIAPLSNYLDTLLRTPAVPKNLDLVISSPGGSVIAGFMFINRMNSLQARGVRFNCYVLDMAASMAFQILTQCDSRQALPTSFLLWHGVRTSSQDITAKAALALAQDLKRMDDLILLQLRKSLNLSASPSSRNSQADNISQIRFHFDRETLWTGLSLHSVDPNFISLDTFSELLLQPADVRSAPMSMFDSLDSYVYKWDGIGEANQ